jgi:hypothetical protein
LATNGLVRSLSLDREQERVRSGQVQARGTGLLRQSAGKLRGGVVSLHYLDLELLTHLEAIAGFVITAAGAEQ